MLNILFLGKKDDAHCWSAVNFLTDHCTVSAYLGKWGDPYPDIGRWEGDYIISYLSRWILPESLIKKAKIAAINFHLGPPDYPGYGCNNFALYNNATEYGVTCHHMAAEVDTGDIIAVERFSVYKNDNVCSLLLRAYDYQLSLFHEVMGDVLQGKELPLSNEKWTRKPYTKKEFNKLFVIKPDMPKEEIDRRIRATSYGEYQPRIEIGGHVFEYKKGDI